jgi:hypothetical protein
MLLLGLALLALVFLLAWRGRPLVPPDRAAHLSERWRLAQLYEHGKQGQ